MFTSWTILQFGNKTSYRTRDNTFTRLCPFLFLITSLQYPRCTQIPWWIFGNCLLFNIWFVIFTCKRRSSDWWLNERAQLSIVIVKIVSQDRPNISRPHINHYIFGKCGCYQAYSWFSLWHRSVSCKRWSREAMSSHGWILGFVVM